MDDVFEITASTLTILACGFELLRLTRRSPAAGEAPRGEDRASDVERFLQLVLGLGAVCLGLAAAAFLFARSEVVPETASSLEGFPSESAFPETSILFALVAIAAGCVALWLGAGVRKTNEGVAFALLLIGAGILTIFFTASLPEPAFSGCC